MLVVAKFNKISTYYPVIFCERICHCCQTHLFNCTARAYKSPGLTHGERLRRNLKLGVKEEQEESSSETELGVDN